MNEAATALNMDSETDTTNPNVTNKEQTPRQHIRPTKSKRIVPALLTTTTTATTTTTQPSVSNSVVQSILRKSPKYTKTATSTNIHQEDTTLSTATTSFLTIESPPTKETETSSKVNATAISTSSHEALSSPTMIQHDLVVERPRDRHRRRTLRHNNNNNHNNTPLDTTPTNYETVPKTVANEIEGYAPRSRISSSTDNTNIEMFQRTEENTTNESYQSSAGNKNDDDDEAHPLVSTPLNDDDNNTNHDTNDDMKPLIFNSLADLMEMAGTLPSMDELNNNGSSTTMTMTMNAPTMIETQLDFSVVDPVDYQQQQNDLFYGITSLPQDTMEDVDHKTTTGMGDDVNDSNGMSPPPTENTVTAKHSGVITIPLLYNVGTDNKNETHDQTDGHRKSLRERFPHKGEDDMDQLSYTTEESNLADSDATDDDDDDDVLLDALKQHSHRREVQKASTPPPPPRAFLLFWNAISQWVTPHAVEFLYQLRHTTTNTASETNAAILMTYQQPNDIALSRCHGLMNIIQLQTSRCWKEYMNIDERFNDDTTMNVGNDNNTRSIFLLRQAEQHVATLLRCMDYTLPTPKFNTIQIRALTCLLLDMVMIRTAVPLVPTNDTHRTNHRFVPLPCTTLGMTYEEYHYLVQSSILSFRTTD
jgi:hypothetical protein